MGSVTALPEGYRTIEVGEDRKDEFLAVDRLAFASSSSPEVDAQVPFTVPLDRAMGVQAPDGRLAAVHGSYPFRLPVPGGEVPCAGLTWVGVRPDERRRGLLTSMIATHVERSLARAEPVSALFAAEEAIYGRFGYGCAADAARLTLPRRAALRPVAGSDALTVRFEAVDADRHDDLVHGLHVAAGAGRPGWVARSTPELRRRILVDPEQWRGGAEPMQIATVHASTGPARGFALLRRTARWGDAGPEFTVEVLAAVALDAAATHRLWTFLLDLDLTVTVSTPKLPVDDVLLSLLVDHRSARPRLEDNLWVRLLDLPTALAGRRYVAPLDTVVEVTDALVPANAGRWRLRTHAPDGTGTWAMSVERTHDDAQLRADVRELGAAYLGGRSLAAFVTAGLVEERVAGTGMRAAAAFGWPVAPLCSWTF